MAPLRKNYFKKFGNAENWNNAVMCFNKVIHFKCNTKTCCKLSIGLLGSGYFDRIWRKSSKLLSSGEDRHWVVFVKGFSTFFNSSKKNGIIKCSFNIHLLIIHIIQKFICHLHCQKLLMRFWSIFHSCQYTSTNFNYNYFAIRLWAYCFFL